MPFHCALWKRKGEKVKPKGSPPKSPLLSRQSQLSGKVSFPPPWSFLSCCFPAFWILRLLFYFRHSQYVVLCGFYCVFKFSTLHAILGRLF